MAWGAVPVRTQHPPRGLGQSPARGFGAELHTQGPAPGLGAEPRAGLWAEARTWGPPGGLGQSPAPRGRSGGWG
ncbi:hypothetical protein GCM10009577_50110 [Streptomyces javensis]